MRTFRIDFSNESNPLTDGDVLGNQGEHNATIIVITPPAEMTENENITSYRIAFELTNCRSVHSASIAKSDEVSLPLFAQITSSETVAIQLEGYDGNGDLVVKSPKISKLKFNPSVCGVELPLSGSSNSLAAEVNLNTNFRNNFAETESGNLTYKGQPIGGGTAERPTKTIELSYDSSEIDFIFNSSFLSFVIYTYNESKVPLNSEILKTELLFDDQNYPDWIDTKEMINYDPTSPYIVYQNKPFFDGSYSTVYFRIFFINNTGVFGDLINAYKLNKVRITYYTD